MKIQLIRNATLWIEYAGKNILVDPMLGPAGSQKPFPNSPRQNLSNPLEDLPVSVESLINPDAVIVTHLHRDHFDRSAQELLPKYLPVYAQNGADAAKIASYGFADVQSLDEPAEGSDNDCNNGSSTEGVVLKGTDIRLIPVEARHSHGEMYAMSGPACGIIMKHPSEKTIYITGDTVWGENVKNALETYRPEIVVMNCGENMVYGYSPLIMGACDVLNVHCILPDSFLVACHMESLNHWMLSKETLREFSENHEFSDRLIIPENGEWIEYYHN